MKTKKSAQVSLELGFALIAVFLLMWGGVAIFIWANNRLILRQEAYESSSDYGRVKATAEGVSGEVLVNEAELPKLDILGEEETE